MRDALNQPGRDASHTNATVSLADRLGLEPLCTGAELRRLLNISDRTLRRLVSSGAIPRPDVVIGTVRRWTPQTVRRILGLTESEAARPRLAVAR